MTATLPGRPTKPGQRRKRDPEKNYVICPADGCDVVTGSLVGLRIDLNSNASGYDDGARCLAHGRTVVDRTLESNRALDIATYRRVGVYQFGLGGWPAADDIAQGTE